MARLADPDPAVRKKAADDLLAGAPTTVTALSVAAGDSSGEIGAAARDILRNIAVGITSRTPDNLLEIVRQYRHGQRLRDDVLLEAAIKAFSQNSPDGVVLLAGLVQFDRLNNGLAHFMPKPMLGDAAQAAPSVAVRLLLEGRELDACRVLHMACLLEETPGKADADFVTLFTLAGEDNEQLGSAWAQLLDIMQKASSANAPDRAREGLRWTGTGALDPLPVRWPPRNPETLAQVGDGPADLRTLAYLCEWPALAARLVPKRLADGQPRDLALVALAHQLANTPLRDEVVAHLVGLAEQAGQQAVATSLLLAARPEEAIRCIKDPALRVELLSQLRRFGEIPAIATTDSETSLPTVLARIEAGLRLGLSMEAAVGRLTANLVLRRDLFEMKQAVEMLQLQGRRKEAIELAAATIDHTAQWDEQSLFQSLYGQRSYDASKLFRWLDLAKAPSPKAALMHIDRAMSGGLEPAELDAMADKLRKESDDLAIVNTLVPTVCRILRQHGQPQRAREMLVKAAKGRFSLNGIKASAGEELMRLGEPAAAARLLEQAASADPDPYLRHLWSVAVTGSGDAVLGRKISRAATLMPLGNIRQRLEQGISLFDEGLDDQARRELTICLRMRQLAPEEAVDALLPLAAIRYQNGEYEGAADAMAQHLALRLLRKEAPMQPIGGDLHRLMRCRVRAAIARRDKAMALARLDEALLTFSEDPVILYDTLGAVGPDADWAIALARRRTDWITRRETLLRQYPDSAELWAGLALVLLRGEGEAARVKELLDKASRCGPDNHLTQLVRAEWLFARGERVAALQSLDGLTRKNPTSRSLIVAARRIQHGRSSDPWPEF